MYNIFMKKIASSIIIIALFIAGVVVLLKGNTKVFTSDKLGISFDYSSSNKNAEYDYAIVTFEQGNKVYVSYREYFNPKSPSGQSVEVFFKNPEESFHDAIKRTILKDYPFSGCSIVDDKISIEKKSNLEYAEITYPSWYSNTEDLDLDVLLADAGKCNQAYDATEAVRYFAYDPNHPDRFVFFNLGQEGIINSKGQLWEDSFQILELKK